MFGDYKQYNIWKDYASSWNINNWMTTSEDCIVHVLFKVWKQEFAPKMQYLHS